MSSFWRRNSLLSFSHIIFRKFLSPLNSTLLLYHLYLLMSRRWCPGKWRLCLMKWLPDKISCILRLSSLFNKFHCQFSPFLLVLSYFSPSCCLILKILTRSSLLLVRVAWKFFYRRSIVFTCWYYHDILISTLRLVHNSFVLS